MPAEKRLDWQKNALAISYKMGDDLDGAAKPKTPSLLY